MNILVRLQTMRVLNIFLWRLTNITVAYQGTAASPKPSRPSRSRWWARLTPSCCRLCVWLTRYSRRPYNDALRRCPQSPHSYERKGHTLVIKSMSGRHTLTQTCRFNTYLLSDDLTKHSFQANNTHLAHAVARTVRGWHKHRLIWQEPGGVLVLWLEWP